MAVARWAVGRWQSAGTDGRSRRQEQITESSIFHFPFSIYHFSHFPLKTGPVKTRAMQAMKNKK